MTYGFRRKYAALIAALIMSLSNTCAHAYAQTAYPGSMGVYGNGNCCENFWASGDLLYLTSCVDGFECAFGNTDITTSVSNGKIVTDIEERDSDIKSDWNAGFRLGIGYDEECSCWDTALLWTHFNQNNTDHAKCHNRAKWKLRFNEVDALVGYKINCSRCFSVRPFFGARYAKIDQKLTTHLSTPITITATHARSVVVSTKNDHERFWGAGPILGFEGEFFLSCGFSAYGNFSGNFLYGMFKNRFNDSDIFKAAVNNCDSSSESCGVLTGFDAGVGVRYATECGATLQLGLEHHKYSDYNQIGCGGDLNLYGVNVSVNMRF